MKKILFFLFMVLISHNVFGQWNNTGNLTIVGNMPVITQIQVIDNGVNLDLSINNINVVVGQLLERSNSISGYTVIVESVNGGGLIGIVSGENTAYSLVIGGVSVDLTAPFVVTDTISRTSAIGVTKNIEVSTNPTGLFLAQDIYTDTLLFTVAPK